MSTASDGRKGASARRTSTCRKPATFALHGRRTWYEWSSACSMGSRVMAHMKALPLMLEGL